MWKGFCLRLKFEASWFQQWNHWKRFEINKKGWKLLKKVVWPAFGCCSVTYSGPTVGSQQCINFNVKWKLTVMTFCMFCCTTYSKQDTYWWAQKGCTSRVECTKVPRREWTKKTYFRLKITCIASLQLFFLFFLTVLEASKLVCSFVIWGSW